ncbi:uncharacterized protein LOC114358947 [Ostrinia furnacalis]|uniref:uncharacterized protein LOC114358947 n=1 Tax=Ostrinia furnacalis TaxID=93504 RepID=UPI00103E53D0|nr:uncharacterized protein LOC114358947 [Ostrinia furnacalis]
MRVTILPFVMFFMWMQGDVDSVRIVELRVGAHLAEGGDALLGCVFDLGPVALYSLKWSKDGKEFYRYMPQAVPQMRSFFVPGVVVDLNRSSLNTVALKHLTRNSSGVYQCSVYGEAPDFPTASRDKRVTVDLLPKTGPKVDGLKTEYHSGSYVDVNCTTTPSRPEAQFKWFINGRPAPSSYLLGPYLVLPTNMPHTYQAKLRLKFQALESHFEQGAMTLKCQATIPPLYLQETHYTFYDPNLRKNTTRAQKNRGEIASTTILLQWFLHLLLVIMNI